MHILIKPATDYDCKKTTLVEEFYFLTTRLNREHSGHPLPLTLACQVNYRTGALLIYWFVSEICA
jgi:hypothetical protein